MVTLVPIVPERQPVFRFDLLEAQNEAFTTLTTALRRLDGKKHHALLSRSLTILLDVEGLNLLPVVSLAELLFCSIDRCTEPRQVLSVQNVIIYVCYALEGRDA